MGEADRRAEGIFGNHQPFPVLLVLHPDPLLGVLSLLSFCHLWMPWSQALSRPCFMDLSPPQHCCRLVSTVHLPVHFRPAPLRAFV